MTHYRVVVANPAKRDIKKLPEGARALLIEALEGLVSTPRPSGAEKLKANPVFLRIRKGNYRVIYAVRDVEQLVIVVVVRDRKDAFKGLDGLDGKLAEALLKVADHILERAVTPGSA